MEDTGKNGMEIDRGWGELLVPKIQRVKKKHQVISPAFKPEGKEKKDHKHKCTEIQEVAQRGKKVG